MPMRYAGPPIFTTSMPSSGSFLYRWLWSIWPRPPLQGRGQASSEWVSLGCEAHAAAESRQNP